MVIYTCMFVRVYMNEYSITTPDILLQFINAFKFMLYFFLFRLISTTQNKFNLKIELLHEM